MDKKVDKLAKDKESTAGKIKRERQEKAKRMREIMGEAGHNRSGKYGK